MKPHFLIPFLLSASSLVAQIDEGTFRFTHPLDVGLPNLEFEFRHQDPAPYVVTWTRERNGVETVLASATISEQCQRLVLPDATRVNDNYTVQVTALGTMNSVQRSSRVRHFRGDFNLDGLVNLADVTSLLDYTLSGVALPYFSTILGDVNGDGALDISDPVALLDFLFQSGTAPVPYDLPSQFAAPGSETPADIDALVAAMADQADANRADYAYGRLYHLRDAAVDPLLNLARTIDPATPFLGTRCYHRESPNVGDPVRFVSVALLLINSMILGDPAPYDHPEFLTAPGEAIDEAGLSLIVFSYIAWHQGYQGVLLASRDLPVPPGTTPPDPRVTDPADMPDEWLDPQWGTPTPGSTAHGGWFRFCAPIELVYDDDGYPLYYKWCWLLVFNDPHYPYAVKETNCLAYALGEEGWWWFDPRFPESLARTLAKHDYDPVGSSIDPGLPCDIAVIHWVCPDQEPDTTTIKHIMKRKQNGKWESKNGRGFHYDDICDLWDWLILGEHYNDPPAGKTIVVRYHVKL